MVINRAKFDARTLNSFSGVKTDIQTDRIALYSTVYITLKKISFITQVVHKVFRQFKKFIDITTDLENVRNVQMVSIKWSSFYLKH